MLKTNAMGTSNFYNRNASKVYAILPECNDEGSYSYVYSDRAYDVKEQMRNATGVEYQDERGSGRDDLRSYESSILGKMYLSKTYLGHFEVTVVITAVMRSGYYEGANLDYYMDYQINGSYYTDQLDNDDLMGDVVYSTSEKMGEYLTPKIAKWISKAQDKLVSTLEGIYEISSTPMVVTARFSNGETMYQKVAK